MKKGIILTAAVVLVMGFGVSSAVVASEKARAITVAQDDVKYDEVSTDELPSEISTAIQEGYGDYTLSKAFKGDDGTYKAKLEKDDEKISVFFNEQGEFLKIEQDSDDSWKGGTSSPADTGTVVPENDPMNPGSDGTGTEGTDPLNP